MGNFSSYRQDIYINEYTNPCCSEQYSKQFLIRNTLNNTIFNDKLLSLHEPEQRIVILGLFVNYVENETNTHEQVIIKNLLPNEEIVSIPCFSNVHEDIVGNKRILYKPVIAESIIKTYAKMGEAIAKSIIDSDKEQQIYKREHPMAYFILNNIEVLETQPEDVKVIEEDKNLIAVKTDFVFKVQKMFIETIYDDLHETKLENIVIDCPKGVYVMLQLDYLLITNGDLKMRKNEIKI
jgi:hypothetical protein